MRNSLWRTCGRLVEGLDVPPEATSVRDLVPVIERMYGRTIMLVPADTGPDAPCGIWLKTAAEDYIFYDPTTVPRHQDHIIGHELGHILRGHHKADTSVPVPPRLLKSVDPAMVRMVLGRTRYTFQDEQEAETIATLLQDRVHRRPLPGATDRAARSLQTRRPL
jgi:hypothetical protein